MVPSLFRNKSFTRLWVAQALAFTAENANHLALIVLTEERTHASLPVALAILSFSLPAILWSMPAGAIADRQDRRRVLMACDLLRALMAFGYLLVYLLLPGAWLLPGILLITFLLSSIGQLAGPCEAGLIPQLVGKERLLQANSLISLTALAAQGAGFLIVGPMLIKWVGVEGVYVANVILYGAAAWLVSTLPSDLSSPSSQSALVTKPASLRAAIREAWQFIFSEKQIAMAMLHLTLANAQLNMLMVIGPGLVVRGLGIGVEDAVYLAIPAGIGFASGAVLLAHYGLQTDSVRLSRLGLLFTGLSLAGMTWVVSGPPVVQGIVISLVLSAGLGLGMALLTVPGQTTLQARSAGELRGRVFSSQMLINNLVSIGPMLLAGALADLIGLQGVLLLVVLMVITVGLIDLRLTARPNH
jgi:MFS family permease